MVPTPTPPTSPNALGPLGITRFLLPIEKLDDIPVKILFSFEVALHENDLDEIDEPLDLEVFFDFSIKHRTLSLPQELFRKSVYSGVLQDDDSIQARYTSAKELCAETIASLSFDNKLGVFTIGSVESEVDYFIQALKDCTKVELSHKECCVCYEFVTTKTRCGHSLCMRCASKLHKQRCPACRRVLKF